MKNVFAVRADALGTVFRLLAPHFAFLTCSKVEERCARTCTIWTTFQKHDLVVFFHVETVRLGFELLTIDNEKFVVV